MNPSKIKWHKIKLTKWNQNAKSMWEERSREMRRNNQRNDTNEAEKWEKRGWEKIRKKQRNETNGAEKWEKRGWKKRRKKQINEWKVLKWASYRIHPPKPHNSSQQKVENSYPHSLYPLCLPSDWPELYLQASPITHTWL